MSVSLAFRAASSPEHPCRKLTIAQLIGSYLIAVVDSEMAAELPEPRSRNHVKVSVAKTVVAIPLESQRLAGAVLQKHSERQRVRQSRLEAAGLRTKKDKDGSVTATDSETDDTASEPGEADSDDPRGPLPPSSNSIKRPFWQRGFSKKKSPPSGAEDQSVPTSNEEVAPSAPGQLAEPTSADERASGAGSSQDATALPEVAATATETPANAADKPSTVSESQHELDVKLVAECLRVMTGLYFSHGTDITRSLQSKHDKADPLRHTPRWRSADRRFWFNENLMSPFVQTGVSTFSIQAPIHQRGY